MKTTLLHLSLLLLFLTVGRPQVGLAYPGDHYLTICNAGPDYSEERIAIAFKMDGKPMYDFQVSLGKDIFTKGPRDLSECKGHMAKVCELKDKETWSRNLADKLNDLDVAKKQDYSLLLVEAPEGEQRMDFHVYAKSGLLKDGYERVQGVLRTPSQLYNDETREYEGKMAWKIDDEKMVEEVLSCRTFNMSDPASIVFNSTAPLMSTEELAKILTNHQSKE